jgi:hypothetical protein
MKTIILLSIISIGLLSNSYVKNVERNIHGFQNPVASADPDQTIYLAQKSTVILDGSESLDTAFRWAKISTNYIGGAIITPLDIRRNDILSQTLFEIKKHQVPSKDPHRS